MSDIDVTGEPSREALDLMLEVVGLPVSDVDRAKGFYQGLGWRLDADIVRGKDFRVVQLTPPGYPHDRQLLWVGRCRRDHSLCAPCMRSSDQQAGARVVEEPIGSEGAPVWRCKDLAEERVGWAQRHWCEPGYSVRWVSRRCERRHPPLGRDPRIPLSPPQLALWNAWVRSDWTPGRRGT